MKTNHYSEIKSIPQNFAIDEAEEGRLNLIAIRDTILRQIHIIGGITAIIASLALYQALRRVPNYQASFEILSEPVTIETKVTSQSRETTEAITADKLDEVQIKTLKSPKLIQEIIDKLSHKYPNLNYSSMVSSLDLKTTNQELTVLAVSYKDPNKEQVKDVLNTISEVYLTYSLLKRQSGVNKGLEFLNQQIPVIQTKIDGLNQQLDQLRTGYNLIDPKIQAVQLSQRLDNLINQQLQYKTQLEKTQKLADIATKELNQQATTSTMAMQLGTSRYNNLLGDLKAIDQKIAQQSAIFSEQNPQIQTLQEQRRKIIALIDQEKAVIQQKINNQIEMQRNQQKNNQEEIANVEQNLQEWSEVTRKFEKINRQMAITERQLNQLLVQRESLRLEASQKEAPWRLLTPPGEPQTDAASTANYVVLGTLLGLLIGMGAALIIDKYQNLVYTTNQLREITDLPILGIIPFDRSNQKLSFRQIIKLIQPSDSQEQESAIQVYNRNPIVNNLLSSSVEAFRFFGANLGLFEDNNSINSLIVTSAVSGEGKSTVVLNLAKATTAIGGRVLVVDADMRSPCKLTTSMALTSNQGLSDLLLSDNLNANRIIQQSSLEENLFILPSGNINNNIDTSKLLASAKMRELMEELKQHFELVIYDVSSIVDYADVNLLANKTDGVVLVTGLGKLQTLKLKEAINQLTISKTPILGILINKITAKV